MTYTDLLHIYGVAKAGYIPQLFSLRLPNPDVILELLQKSKGVALIHDVIYLPALHACPDTLVHRYQRFRGGHQRLAFAPLRYDTTC